MGSSAEVTAPVGSVLPHDEAIRSGGRPLRVCMVLFDLQEFGGLEEYLCRLAIGLSEIGHKVSVLCTVWVSEDNQYKRRLLDAGVRFVEPPRWLSEPASDWATKLRILSRLVALSWPLLTVLTIPRLVMKGGGWRQARASTEGWWRQRLLDGGLAKDRRSTIGQWLLM